MAAQKLLFVEGVDDQHAVRNLLGTHDIEANLFTFSEGEVPKIEDRDVISVGAGAGDKGGFEFLRQNLPRILRLESELRCAGIVVDYDFPEREEGQVNRWRSLRELLQDHFECDLPQQPPAEGWTGQVERPEGPVEVGIWLMPDNQAEGALEAFAKRLISEEDMLLAYAEDCLEELPVQRFAEKDRDKALIHTWLAWQEKPNMRIGEAVSADVLDSEQPLAERFVDWTRQLFEG